VEEIARDGREGLGRLDDARAPDALHLFACGRAVERERAAFDDGVHGAEDRRVGVGHEREAHDGGPGEERARIGVGAAVDRLSHAADPEAEPGTSKRTRSDIRARPVDVAGWTLALELAEPAEGGGLPTFVRIARAIAEDIRRGRLRAGDGLPGTRTLAGSLG